MCSIEGKGRDRGWRNMIDRVYFLRGGGEREEGFVGILEEEV